MWKVLMKEVNFGRTNMIPWPRLFGLHSTRMRNEHRYCGQSQKYVWIQDPCRSKRNATLFRETWCGHLLMVLWYGRSCKEMCGATLCGGEQNNPATLHCYNSMLWWPSIQRRRVEIRGRIVKSMLSNCLEMLTLGTYWTTWYFMVSK